MFSFDPARRLELLDGFMGQERAFAAMAFGTAMEQPGFHLFVLGPQGTGRHTAVRNYLSQLAATRPPPADWIYVARSTGRTPSVAPW